MRAEGMVLPSFYGAERAKSHRTHNKMRATTEEINSISHVSSAFWCHTPRAMCRNKYRRKQRGPGLAQMCGLNQKVLIKCRLY